jgi:hypothetical protein
MVELVTAVVASAVAELIVVVVVAVVVADPFVAVHAVLFVRWLSVHWLPSNLLAGTQQRTNEGR